MRLALGCRYGIDSMVAREKYEEPGTLHSGDGNPEHHRAIVFESATLRYASPTRAQVHYSRGEK